MSLSNNIVFFLFGLYCQKTVFCVRVVSLLMDQATVVALYTDFTLYSTLIRLDKTGMRKYGNKISSLPETRNTVKIRIEETPQKAQPFIVGNPNMTYLTEETNRKTHAFIAHGTNNGFEDGTAVESIPASLQNRLEEIGTKACHQLE